jgi:cytochrome c
MSKLCKLAMKKILLLLGLCVLPGLNAEVMEITLPIETAVFKPAPGVQYANGQCLTCHSADYIAMQPPKGLEFWQAEVTKMKDKYGAPLPTNQLQNLAEYLAVNYGTGIPAPMVVETQKPSGPLDGHDLAQKNGCLNCHNVEIKIVGPAYKDVAAKYRGRPDAMDRVSHQITHGGSGQWGQFPMPPFPQFTPEEVSTLARWVLEQK